MASTVFTGWRNITPGKCDICGLDNEWSCDGAGNVYCSCHTCPECHMFNGHEIGCSVDAAHSADE